MQGLIFCTGHSLNYSGGGGGGGGKKGGKKVINIFCYKFANLIKKDTISRVNYIFNHK